MTIVIDTSSLAAIVFGEPDGEMFSRMLATYDDEVCIGAPTLVEAEIVVESRQGAAALADLRGVLAALGVRTIGFDAEHARLAADAWRRYGRGRHPAALNLGDCCSYATAKSLGAPLVYKGTDFSQTDIVAAVL